MIDQLKWHNICIDNPITKKSILKNINGHISSGQFLTIMGASGSGKTSFLQYLTCRFNAPTGFKASGTVTINDIPYDLDQFSKFGVYVNQNDILFSSLTVEQTIRFQADMRIKSEQQKVEKVKNVIRTLGLQQCKNIKIGGQFIKSISGGQRRRVVIALELISDPNCIVLDEPTSGLDSYNSSLIINILIDLAKNQNKIIMATIHQPSSSMFHKFDKLMLMKNGQMLYFGRADRIMSYMKQLKINLNMKMNPADFFMYEISDYNAKTNKYLTPMTAQKFYEKRLQQINRVSEHHKSLIIQQKIKHQKEQISVFKQFKYLLFRAALNWIRNPINLISKIGNIIILSSIMTLLYYNLGKQEPFGPTPLNEIFDFLTKFSAAIFLALFCSFGMNIYEIILVCNYLIIKVPYEKQIFYRESSSNLYNSYIYFITRYLIQLPGIIISPLITINILYYTLALQSSDSFYYYLLLNYLIVGMSGSHYGLIVGILFDNSNTAIALLPLVLIPIILFGGLIVNLSTLHPWIAWIKYLSSIQYAFNSIVQKKFEFSGFEVDIGGGNWVPLDYKSVIGLQNSADWSLIMLGVITIIILLMALVLLILNKKKV